MMAQFVVVEPDTMVSVPMLTSPGFDELTVYPNPSAGMLKMDVALDEIAEVEVEVFNITGQRVYYRNEGFSQAMHRRIDLRNQPAGVYMVKVSAGNRVATTRVVLR